METIVRFHDKVIEAEGGIKLGPLMWSISLVYKQTSVTSFNQHLLYKNGTPLCNWLASSFSQFVDLFLSYLIHLFINFWCYSVLEIFYNCLVTCLPSWCIFNILCLCLSLSSFFPLPLFLFWTAQKICFNVFKYKNLQFFEIVSPTWIF